MFLKERMSNQKLLRPITEYLGLKTVPKNRSRSNDIHINGEEMYIRLLAINSFKKVSLQRVMILEKALYHLVFLQMMET